MTVIPEAPTGPLRLVPIQQLTLGGRWRTEAMRSHRVPVLLWFTRGQGRITIAGVTRGYGTHNVVFLPPGTMHGFEVTAKTFGTAVFFGPTAEFDLPQEPAHIRIRDAVAQGEMTVHLDNLQREIDGNRPQRTLAISCHARLLSVWLHRQLDDVGEKPQDRGSEALVRRYTTLIEQQLYTGSAVATFAEELGVTPTHLSRVCRQSCGMSALEILKDRRNFEARRLLLDTTLPVKDVAQLLGYNSPAYFTRDFVHHTGQAPSEFRQSRKT